MSEHCSVSGTGADNIFVCGVELAAGVLEVGEDTDTVVNVPHVAEVDIVVIVGAGLGARLSGNVATSAGGG